MKNRKILSVIMAVFLLVAVPSLALAAPAGSAIGDIQRAVSALTPDERERECYIALGRVALYIEEAMRQGSALEVPAGGALYGDLLRASAYMANFVSGSALAILADAGALDVPFWLNISFVSSAPDALYVHFPEDVSGVGFDKITLSASFAALTVGRGDISRGDAIRIELDVPVAAGYYVSVADAPFNPLDFWAVGVVIIIVVAWGVLASMGKKLRLWVVPTFTVLAIAANMWTLGLHENERPGDAPAHVYSYYPYYFHSVVVDMPPGMEAVLSIPLGGESPEGLVVVNELGEWQYSRFNPVTGNMDAYIRDGGVYAVTYVGYAFVRSG